MSCLPASADYRLGRAASPACGRRRSSVPSEPFAGRCGRWISRSARSVASTTAGRSPGRSNAE